MHKQNHPTQHPQCGLLAHWLGRFWLWLFGWRVTGEIPTGSKFVLIGAHHTSNWDLPFGLAATYVFRLKLSWLGKQSLFQPPLGWFIRLLGGLPVDRDNPNGVVGQIAERYRTQDQLVIAMAPSGTRSKRDHWRSGFYWMAHEAGVPILCGYLDYPNKTAHIGLCFHPTGDVAADMDRIRAFYQGISGKFPEKETPVRLRDESGTEN